MSALQLRAYCAAGCSDACSDVPDPGIHASAGREPSHDGGQSEDDKFGSTWQCAGPDGDWTDTLCATAI